jgi:hypothetical protein
LAETEQQTKTEAKTEDRTQIFQVLDHRDENQILAEMRGEILEDLVYDVTIQGKRVTNLSYAGVKEAIRHRGNVEILDVHIEETDKEIRVTIKMRDLQNRIDVIGASSVEKEKPFAYILAVNKAERNAFAKLIPAKWLATLIDDYRTKKTQVQTQSKIPENVTPTPQKEQPIPHVPIVKDTLKMEGLRQFPLCEGLKAIGMLNVFEDEISICPEHPFKIDGPTITNFLIPKVLEPMVAKYSFSYSVAKKENGDLDYILVIGKLSDQQIKELQAAARWSFSKALEKTEEK